MQNPIYLPVIEKHLSGFLLSFDTEVLKNIKNLVPYPLFNLIAKPLIDWKSVLQSSRPLCWYSKALQSDLLLTNAHLNNIILRSETPNNLQHI